MIISTYARVTFGLDVFVYFSVSQRDNLKGCLLILMTFFGGMVGLYETSNS